MAETGGPLAARMPTSDGEYAQTTGYLTTETIHAGTLAGMYYILSDFYISK